MKKIFIVLVLLSLVFLTACSGQEETGVETQGNVYFNLDFSQLIADAQIASTEDTTTITAVNIVLSRTDYTDIPVELTVSNNIATGKVDDLVAGYWHIEAEAYDNETLVFTGNTDVNVISGKEVQANILFDAVEDPNNTNTDTGSISINVGINPLSGYKVIDQNIDKIFMDDINNKIYIWDKTTSVIGIYEGDTFNQIDDIQLEQAPLSMSLNYDKTGLLLGYPSGRIYLLDFTTKEITFLVDSMFEVKEMLPFTSNYVLIDGAGGYDDQLKTVDISTGQIISTKNIFYSFSQLIFNSKINTFYTSTVGVSPNDIHYIKVDASTGEILSTNDSRYHGDYGFGKPLKIINNGTKLATASGNVFTSEEVEEEDLVYTGNLGFTYADLLSDDSLGYLYLINRNDSYYDTDIVRKLIILNQSDFFVDQTIDLKGNPEHIFQTDSSIIVISEDEEKYYSKIFDKFELGLE